MTCAQYGNLHINFGPKTRREVTAHKRSAAWCPDCKQRRVQTFVMAVPIEPSYYDAHGWWECPCGGKALTCANY